MMGCAVSYPEVTVIIPALNEELSLRQVLTHLPEVGQVIVVDNGSTDRTSEIARSNGATVVSEPTRGYGRACQTGLESALRDDARVLVILDADFSDYPEDLHLLVDPILRDEADLVMGDRTALAEPGALLPQQRLGNALATFLIGRITGHRYRDMGPFRAIDRSSLVRLQMEDLNFGWNVEMQIKAIRRGLRVREVPTRYRPRIGQSKISGTVRGSLRAGTKILWSTWRYGR
ncbi:MAG: glycosyltransferase family 2 protein [Myxococcota bacterium]|jgi:glycosyltransferase involved in cell wall biosynthesis|nr:glycosyltransferase family 2 protein [Myxococcota bacterium]